MNFEDMRVDALQCTDDGCQEKGTLVLHKEVLKRHTDKSQYVLVAQFDKLVKSSVLRPEFVFSGLNRALFNDDNADDDNNKLIYVSNPRFDYIWKGDKFSGYGYAGDTEKIEKPKNCVFTVIVSKNKRHKGEYGDVFGFIEEWSWCYSESSGKKPVDWIDRYGKLIYNKLNLI